MSARIARTRAEAIAMGASYWIVPEEPRVRSLAEVDQDIAELQAEVDEKEARARAIEGGYEPPIPGQMFLVQPACSRRCLECTFACSTFIGFVPTLRAGLDELRAERAAIQRAQSGDEKVLIFAEQAALLRRGRAHG